MRTAGFLRRIPTSRLTFPAPLRCRERRERRVPPFGTDDGFDEVHDWAERIDDLRRHPTLRHMLGTHAGKQIGAQEAGDLDDDDDIVIALGFTLLRFTGQIDTEGRRWLRNAL